MNSKALAKTWPFKRYSDFRREVQKAAVAWFLERGFASNQMPYCLRRWEDWPQNIILDEVKQFIKEQKIQCEKESKPFPLHKYLHHGLSSQAMAFNLIGPLVTRKDYITLYNALTDNGINVNFEIGGIEFEFENRETFNEDTGQPTSVDIVIKDKNNNPQIFIESKYVEQKFGGCSVYEDGDCNGENPIHSYKKCFLNHIGRKYWEILSKYGFDKSFVSERHCPLACNYQFFRELLFSLENGGQFILLYDERSPVFHRENNGDKRGLIDFLLKFIPHEIISKIHSFSIQSIVTYIKQSGKHADWIKEFEKKYGLN